MDYELSIRKILHAVKTELKLTQAEIARSIGRNKGYISDALNGENIESCYNLLQAKYGHLVKDVPPTEEQIKIMANLLVLVEELALLKAHIQNRKVEDVMKELRDKASLAILDLRKNSN